MNLCWRKQIVAWIALEFVLRKTNICLFFSWICSEENEYLSVLLVWIYSEENKYLSVLLLDLCRWIFNMAGRISLSDTKVTFVLFKRYRLCHTFLEKKTIEIELYFFLSKLSNWIFLKRKKRIILEGASYLVQSNNWQRRSKESLQSHSVCPILTTFQHSSATLSFFVLNFKTLQELQMLSSSLFIQSSVTQWVIDKVTYRAVWGQLKFETLKII